MNKYYQYFNSSKGNRDPIFQDVLRIFDGRPISILEIGAARSLDFYNRQGDGWSSYHYYDYINKNGGVLSICDIDANALNTCKELFEGLNVENVRFINGDGLKKINDSYDLIYLDGGDDPNDMVQQLNLIDFSKQVVLCDDYHTKGSYAKKTHTNSILYKWTTSDHEMALFRPRYKQGILYIEEIQ